MLDEPTADPWQIIAELRRERDEALKYQTATSEVLKVISHSTFGLQAVLDTLLETAARLCNAEMGLISNRVGDVYRPASTFAFSPEWESMVGGVSFALDRGSVTGRAALEQQVVHVPDIAADPEHRLPEVVTVGKMRTALGVPMMREGQPIGVLYMARTRVEPFTERQIELVHTFADQAVIAIENARLINETREALEQQAAIAEVLQVINSSPGDLAPVFEAVLSKALRLCDAAFGFLDLYDGSHFRRASTLGVPEPLRIFRAEHQQVGGPQGPGKIRKRILTGENVVRELDLKDDESYRAGEPNRRAAVDLGGARSAITVALRNENALRGIIAIYRQEVRSFSDKHVILLQNFAAQAVIAIENARLINETREALEQQTATAEVLQVINASPGDLAPVFDAMLEKAMRLCEAAFGEMYTFQGDHFKPVALRGVPQAHAEFRIKNPPRATPGTFSGRIVAGMDVIEIPDLMDEEAYRNGNPSRRGLVELGGARSAMGVALRKNKELLGAIFLFRQEVRPFTGKQIALLENFAAQAVIAMENARLLHEIRQRQAELRVTFDNMGDGVAMFDGERRLAAWNRNFQQMLDLPDAFLEARPSFAEYFDYLAKRGEYGSTEREATLRHEIAETGRELRFERTRPDGRIIEVRRNKVPGGGFVLIYGDVTERKRAEADIRAARDAAEQALSDLKAAQASLLHAQKMAALGQLTAGIAHEIKNPLNFVNNFAALSNELLAELKEMAAPALVTLDADTSAEIDETIEMLTGNLNKIAEHGSRADNIVKSMLAHSRGSSGERTQVDLNALIDEALNLAYHGARAQDQNFNITMERDFDKSLAPVELVPQDMMRVFINLIGNGFHATHQRRQEAQDPGFRPVLTVTTRDLGDAVEVRVRDNGTGIRPEHRDKLFQPFFTTKPTGEGTGLGLSISYEIVTQEHGGTITVESEPDSFTEFAVRLPRTGRSRAEPAPLADGAAGRAA